MDSYEDLWGMVGAQAPVYYLYNAFGHKWARVNEDGRIDYEFSQDDGNTSGLHVASNLDGYLQLSATGTTDVVSVFRRAGDTAIDCMNKINNLIDGKPYESN